MQCNSGEAWLARGVTVHEGFIKRRAQRPNRPAVPERQHTPTASALYIEDITSTSQWLWLF